MHYSGALIPPPLSLRPSYPPVLWVPRPTQAIIKVLMFFYFPYVLNAFQMFFCTSINGEYYLSADLSVGCVGDEYATCRLIFRTRIAAC